MEQEPEGVLEDVQKEKAAGVPGKRELEVRANQDVGRAGNLARIRAQAREWAEETLTGNPIYQEVNIMPGFDKTGPMGGGPFTGGGRGGCNTATTEYRGPVPRRDGFGFGLGRGFRSGRGFNRSMRRGFGRGFAEYQPLSYAAYTTGDSGAELNALKAEKESMKSALDTIKKRIDELEKSSG